MKRILIFRPGQLGDTLVTLPAVHAIRNHFANAELTYLYDYHYGKGYVLANEILKGSGLIDHFIPYFRSYSFFGKVRATFELLSLLFKLRRFSYDCVILLEPNKKTFWQQKRDWLFFRFAGVRNQKSCSSFHRFVDSQVSHLVESQQDFYLRAIGMLGIKVPKLGHGCMDLGLKDAEDEEFYEWLLMKQLKEFPQHSIAVCVGAKQSHNLWPIACYRSVLCRLIKTHQVMPVFFGGSGDKVIAEALIDDLGVGLNACGELSVRGSARVLQECLFYLGNDTGSMHLSVAAGLKCVGIFSFRDLPGEWYPYGDGHKVHCGIVNYLDGSAYRIQDDLLKALTSIRPDDVYKSCVELLEITSSTG